MARNDDTVAAFQSITVIAEGTLGKDPVDRSRDEDGDFVTFSIACNDRKTNGDEGTIWYNVIANIRANGPKVIASCKQGTRVKVIGKLYDDSWENNDGDIVPKQTIRADSVDPAFRFQDIEIEREARRGGGGSNRRSQRDDDDNDGYDDDEEEEQQPRRRRASSRGRASRNASGGGSRRRAVTDRGDDDESEFDD